MVDDPFTPKDPKAEDDPSTSDAENKLTSRSGGANRPGEERVPRRRGTGTLIHRFTGSLRRVTSFLGTGDLKAEQEAPEETPAKPEVKPRVEPVEPAGMDWQAELRQSTGMEMPAADQQPPQASPAEPDAGMDDSDISMDRMLRMTGQLNTSFTGYLRDADEDDEDQDLTDDELTGRLGGLEPSRPEMEERIEAVWDEPPVYPQAETPSAISFEDIWGAAEEAGQVSPSEAQEPVLPGAEESIPPARASSMETPTEDDISDLRQALSGEKTKDLRSTGLLRRFTGALRAEPEPADAPEDDRAAPEEEADDVEDFISGRLGLGGALSTPVETEPEPSFMDLSPVVGEEEIMVPGEPAVEPPPFELVETEAAGEPEQAVGTPGTAPLDWSADEESAEAPEAQPPAAQEPEPPMPTPPSPHARGVTGQLRSLVTGMLPGARRAAKSEVPDDMITGRLERSMTGGLIREKPEANEPEAAGPELPEGESPFDTPGDVRKVETDALSAKKPGSTRRKGVTSQLRSFITSILGNVEEPDGEIEAPEIPEKRVTGRMGSTVTDEPPPAETVDIWGPPFETRPVESREPSDIFRDLAGAPPPEPFFTTPATTASLPEEPVSGDRFSIFFGDQAEVDAAAPVEDETEEYEEEEYEEEEEEEVEEKPKGPTTASLFGDVSEEDLVASYLGGMDLPESGLKRKHKKKKTTNSLGEVSKEGPKDLAAYDMRAVALEGYQEPHDVPPPLAEVTQEVQPVEFPPLPRPVMETAGDKFRLKDWLSDRRNFRKVIIAEIVLILLVALLLSPLWLPALRGALSPAGPGSYQSPNALPAGVPYPVQVTFPGGWEFRLERSTFIEGKWQPKTAEWLEGTELRRVLALPWNPQTEAVVKTFKTGDTIEVQLSNQDKVAYKIVSIDRLPVSDTSVFTDTRRSLVIILFEENTDQRWVVTCQPA